MGRAYRGPYARQSSYNPGYATAEVWGTGIDPIHSYYGEGPPLRQYGRAQTLGASPVANLAPGDRPGQSPMESNSLDPPQDLLWGYPHDMGFDGPQYGPESFGSGADSGISQNDIAPPITQYMNGRPSWNTPADEDRLRRDASTMAPWGIPGVVIRKVWAGSHRFRIVPGLDPSVRGVNGVSAYQPIAAEPSASNPTETVSDGWLNKITSTVAEAHPSDPSQYEIQTSMAQRFGVRDNMRSVDRCTDDPRATIDSRVEPMIAKQYSGQDPNNERAYDMFPFQIDQIERPFRYRTAGVGRADWMETNEINSLTAVQRTPPPDPSAGTPEVYENYGYQAEDGMYFSG